MRFFGKYERFELSPNADTGQILSADNAVGDIYRIDIEIDKGEYTAWLINAFKKKIGYFDITFSRELALLSAEGLTEKAILSFIAYSADEDNGVYWGEACVICFDPAYGDEFNRFIKGVAGRISDDVRPKIDMNSQTAENIIASNGNWLPSQNIILPDQSKDLTYIKRRRRGMEKIIDQGRAHNKGCYVASWAIILIFLFLVIYIVKSVLGL